MRLLRQASLLPIERRQVGCRTALRQPSVADSPSANDVLEKHRAGIGSRSAQAPVVLRLLPTAGTHEEKQRQFQIVNDVPQRIASLEQPGTLQQDNGPLSAQQQAASYGDGLALSTDANQRQSLRPRQGRVPLAQIAVGQPDHMTDTSGLKGDHHISAVEHTVSFSACLILAAALYCKSRESHMATLEQDLIAEAHRLGFELAGIAPAVPADGFDRLQHWLEQGYAGQMSYMHRHAEARRHPSGVFPTVRSVVMVAMNYAGPTAEVPPTMARVARYARGADYHHVVRQRLRELGRWLRGRRPDCWGRIAVDTAPLLERDFARRAGLGWFGKNTMLLNPRLGSWFVLGALLLDIELQATEPFTRNHCGSCTACLKACPTQAFVEPGVLDARKCISYLTIELKSSVPEELRPSLDNWLFGCDICQEVCPWNRKAPPGGTALAPRADLLAVDPRQLLGLTAEQFRERFEGTALHPRPGRPVLLRNAALVLGNIGTVDDLPVLHAALDDPEPLIREAANWAIERIAARAARSL